MRPQLGVVLQHLTGVGKGVVHQLGIRPGVGQAESAALTDARAPRRCQEVAGASLSQILFGDLVAVVGGAHDLQPRLGGLAAPIADEDTVGFPRTATAYLRLTQIW